MDESDTFRPSRPFLYVGAALIAFSGLSPSLAGGQTAEDLGGIGFPATQEQIRAWNIDVSPTGEGLPSGKGTMKRGAEVFAAKCASCHGPSGTEGPKDRLVGGRNTLQSPTPVKTIGSYWPYATTLFDYINRAMPFDAPQSLTPDETYSVIAWLLFQNQIIAEDDVIDAKTLPMIHMPHRNGFIPDPRPDVR